MRAELPLRVTTTVVLILVLCLPKSFRAQNFADQTTFKAETRQVLVDVVVTDHGGHFIPGLTPTDFTVMEDGKPQKIAGFGVHSQPATPPKASPPIKLPPNQYTNYQIADPERPITIVLLDVLNTDVQDQAYTKKQMIAFLRNLPSGQRVALFSLGTHLRTIQGFTGDSDTLVKAANMLLRNASPLMTSERDTQDAEITASNIAVNAGPSPPPQGSINASILAPVTQALADGLVDQQVGQQNQRMDSTLSALQAWRELSQHIPGARICSGFRLSFPSGSVRLFCQ